MCGREGPGASSPGIRRALGLILNSLKALYLERLELFGPIVDRREELLSDYMRAAEAIAARDRGAAAAAVERLAAAQEARMAAR